MKEYQVKGLMELKDEYAERLHGIEDYQALATEFQGRALALVKEAMESERLQLKEAPHLAVAMDRAGDVDLIRAKSCGFCQACITDCSGCVCYA